MTAPAPPPVAEAPAVGVDFPPPDDDPPSDGRSAERAELLARLDRAGRLAPDLRFGQLVDFVAFMAECDAGRGIGDVEDGPLLDARKRFEADLRRRAAA